MYKLETRRTPFGYLILRTLDRNRNQIREHVLIAEKAMGKPLPIGAEVHHANEIKSDNRPQNLVVCPNHKYHQLLHMRMRAYKACGNADWRKCKHCQKYDDPKSLRIRKSPRMAYHLECKRIYQINYRK